MHEQTTKSLSQLGSWVANLRWTDVPPDVTERLQFVWADFLTVASAGAQLPEYQALLDVWPLPSGPVPIPGTNVSTTAESGAWIIGTVGVSLEQDEGNKFAKGHPAAHVLPAVLALAMSLGSSGEDCALALAAGYEVAARFGRATTLNAGVHPHGNWGVAAAAAGCAKLLGLDAVATAAAIDHGSGMAIAGHFSSAVDGNLVRNSWMGAAQMSGIASAYLSASGAATNTGTAADSLGKILGTWNPDALTEQLGERWDVRTNYFKVHAACAFTHPPIDAVLQLAAEHPELSALPAAEFESIEIETHYLAAGLADVKPASRLSAMFSIPYVTAVALREGKVTPEQHGNDRLVDTDILTLAAITQVRHDPDLSARLPAERAARVRITLNNGEVFQTEVPNPIGDSEFAPLTRTDLISKGERLIEPKLVRNLWHFAEQLPTTTSVTELSHLLTLPNTHPDK